eukprot:TRINITY_DN78490_c0_g1_i1.p1 TRINITY_DN78490_c0_g1~~TRINITY_DN78490_c0_g1_i1.p1  ORF type:complete len:107 (-),score=19.64 TRINITY_DN78490_c0_g1_i1:68-388(-)
MCVLMCADCVLTDPYKLFGQLTSRLCSTGKSSLPCEEPGHLTDLTDRTCGMTELVNLALTLGYLCGLDDNTELVNLALTLGYLCGLDDNTELVNLALTLGCLSLWP